MFTLPDPPDHSSSLLEIGVVTRPHGVCGQIKLRLHNPASTALARGAAQRVFLGEPTAAGRWIELEVVGSTNESLIVAVAGVETRDQAEALRGHPVSLRRAELPPPPEGQYYYVDLIGCQVVDEAGQELGRVHDLFEAGASDILVIRCGPSERYVPLVERWVPAVDLTRREITVRDIDEWDSWEAGQ